MITAKDVQDHVKALADAIAGNKQKLAADIGFELFGQFMVDVHRIADALEKIAENTE